MNTDTESVTRSQTSLNEDIHEWSPHVYRCVVGAEGNVVLNVERTNVI